MLESRWFISRVTARAFKSVGSCRLNVSFKPGLTCIVGPNGSGKSNLLDAVCFACGSSPLPVGVRRLADLQCTDVQEVCEVTVGITSSVDGRTHSVICELAKDAGRIYRLDGKLKTSKDIKAFLKERSIDLDQSCCLIRQAQVTTLADSNSPEQLATLIHDTSGYTRWANEAAAALEELKKTTKALQEICGNVKCLEVGVAEDEVKYGAAARLAKLDGDLVDVQQDMAACLQAHQAALAHDWEQAHTQLASWQAAVQSQVTKLAQLERCSNHLKEALTALHEEEDHSLQKQRRLVAAAEEEVHVAEKQSAQARQVTQGVEEAKSDNLQFQAQLLKAGQALHSQQQFVMTLQAAADEAAQGRSETSFMIHQQQLLQQLQKEEQIAQEQVKTAETTTAESQQAMLQAQQQLSRAEAKVAALETTAAEAGTDTGTDTAALSMAVGQKGRAVLALKQEHADKQQQAEMHRLGLGSLLVHAPPGSTVPKQQMLHECFTFKQLHSAGLVPLMEALNLIAGDKLGTVLVDSAAAAADVLAWYSKGGSGGLRHGSSSRGVASLRVWDMQRLHSYDKLQQQKQAQAHFPPGHVLLPLDLLQYKPDHHAAMVRAFGGSVIVKDDATAAQVVTQFGLACITLDGRVSRPGSMQGGWRGPTRAESGPMARKLVADQLQEAVVALQDEVHEAETDCSAAQDRLARQEAQAADLAAAKGDALSAREEEQHYAKEAAAQQQRYEQSVEALTGLQARMHQTQQLVSTCSSAAGNTAGTAPDLEQQLKSARLKMEGLTHQQEALTVRVEAASDHVMLAADHVEGLDMGSLQQQLLDKQTALKLCSVHLQELQVKAALQASAASDKSDQLAAVTQQQTDTTKALQGAQQSLKAAQSAMADLENHRQQVDKDLKSLMKQVPELSSITARRQLQQTCQSVHTDSQSHAKQLRQMQMKCRKLQDERKVNKAHQVPPQDQMQFERRKADLGMFKERAEALQRAVTILEEGIAASRAQVVQTDEAIFDAVQAKFSTLTASLLPKLELKIKRVSREVHEGLQFMHRSSAAASKDPQTSWQSNLGRLSGGERTLVSLALILAAATAGAKSSLFLMDEVDAALDESNQALVATLIKEIMTQNRGCQVLCVTHNLAFQQICSSVVQVTKNENGATVLQDSGSV